MRRSKQEAMLVLMPVPRIKRTEIAEIVRLRGVIRSDRKRLLEMGHSVMARMQKGIRVEPGSTPVEIDTSEYGSAIMTRLLVDGRAVDDFS